MNKQEWESASIEEKEKALAEVGFGMMARPEGTANSLAERSWEELPRETKGMWGYHEVKGNETLAFRTNCIDGNDHKPTVGAVLDTCVKCGREIHETSEGSGYWFTDQDDRNWDTQFNGEVKAEEVSLEVMHQARAWWDKKHSDRQWKDMRIGDRQRAIIAFIKDPNTVLENFIKATEDNEEEDVALLTRLLDNELEEEEKGHDETEDIALVAQLLDRETSEEFKEDEHPREDSGKFTSGGGTSGGAGEKPEKKRFTLASYRRNEGRNEHGANALNLVKQYGTPEEVKEMEGIMDRHKKEGRIGGDDYKRRYEISQKYYDNLLKDEKEGKKTKQDKPKKSSGMREPKKQIQYTNDHPNQAVRPEGQEEMDKSAQDFESGKLGGGLNLLRYQSMLEWASDELDQLEDYSVKEHREAESIWGHDGPKRNFLKKALGFDDIGAVNRTFGLLQGRDKVKLLEHNRHVKGNDRYEERKHSKLNFYRGTSTRDKSGESKANESVTSWWGGVGDTEFRQKALKEINADLDLAFNDYWELSNDIQDELFIIYSEGFIGEAYTGENEWDNIGLIKKQEILYALDKEDVDVFTKWEDLPSDLQTQLVRSGALESNWKRWKGELHATEGGWTDDYLSIKTPTIGDIPSFVSSMAKGYGRQLGNMINDKSGDWKIQVREGGQWKDTEWGGTYFGKDGAEYDANMMSQITRVVKVGEAFDTDWACPRCGNKNVKIKYDENGLPVGRECPKCGLGKESKANENEEEARNFWQTLGQDEKNTILGTYGYSDTEQHYENYDSLDFSQKSRVVAYMEGDWGYSSTGSKNPLREAKATESEWRVQTITHGEIPITLGKQAEKIDAINAVKRMYFDEGFIDENEILGAVKTGESRATEEQISPDTYYYDYSDYWKKGDAYQRSGLALQANIPTSLIDKEWDELPSDVQSKIREAGYVTSYEAVEPVISYAKEFWEDIYPDINRDQVIDDAKVFALQWIRDNATPTETSSGQVMSVGHSALLRAVDKPEFYGIGDNALNVLFAENRIRHLGNDEIMGGGGVTIVGESYAKEEAFKEEEHPREDSGKFTSGGGSGGGDSGGKHSKTSTKDLIKSIKGGNKDWHSWGRTEKNEELYAEMEKRNKEIPKPTSKLPDKVFRDDPDAVKKMEKKVKYWEDQKEYWNKITKFPSRDYQTPNQLGDAKWFMGSNISTNLRDVKKKLEGIKAQQGRGTDLVRKPTYKDGKKRFYYSEEPKGEPPEEQWQKGGEGYSDITKILKKSLEYSDSDRKVSPNSLMRYTEPIDLPTGKNALDQTWGTTEPETPDGQDLTGKTIGEEEDSEYERIRGLIEMSEMPETVEDVERWAVSWGADKDLVKKIFDQEFGTYEGDEEIIEKKPFKPTYLYYKQHPFGVRKDTDSPFGEAVPKTFQTFNSLLGSTEDYEGSECNICGLDENEHNENTGHEFTPAIIAEGGQGSGRKPMWKSEDPKTKEKHHVGWKNYGIDDYIDKAFQDYTKKSEEEHTFADMTDKELEELGKKESQPHISVQEGRWDDASVATDDNPKMAKTLGKVQLDLLKGTDVPDEHISLDAYKQGFDWQEGQEQEEEPAPTYNTVNDILFPPKVEEGKPMNAGKVDIKKVAKNKTLITPAEDDDEEKATEGGKGSGKSGHQSWMRAIEEDHTYDFCENCNMITEQVNHKCDMCGKTLKV